ncbi:MAG: hypothetical protein RLZZ127_556 [Planctomycetota bacterium]|jgi:outer membrane protein assembly factor BamB/tetratricopeptide (TPR) repeat protein
MGFQGQLSSVNLTDIVQTLAMNRQTGTMSVAAPAGTVRIHFNQGQIAAASAPPVDGKPFLIHALLKRGLLAADQADELARRLRTIAQPLRDLLLASAYIADADLDEVCAWCVEEVFCPVFEWTEGEFSFSDGPITPDLQGFDAVELGPAGMQTTSLILEATRRRDEWKRIREVIPDEHALYIVDNDGRPNLKNVQTDPDMLKVVRYLDGRHSLASIARQVGVTQFDTFAIVAQLVLAQVARPRTTQEIVEDAAALRQAGEAVRCRDLLEVAVGQARIPEVLRPLAEACAATEQVPRAVEIYLELIQHSQDDGDLEQALVDLDTVLALSPEDPELHADRGHTLADLGRADEAAQAFCTAAQSFLATKDAARAIDTCHRAKNLVPRAPEPHRHLARAYLIDGQTENAVVEYKALWHALLAGRGPRKALEELEQVLASDCKYQAVKDQVLAHARASESVKTSRAVRTFIYVAAGVVLAVAAVFGAEYYRQVVFERNGLAEVDEVNTAFRTGQADPQHAKLIAVLDETAAEYAGVQAVQNRITEVRDTIQRDYEARARIESERAEALVAGGQYAKALETARRLEAAFPGTQAAAQAATLRERIVNARIDVEVSGVVSEARRRWAADDWDGALVLIAPILDRQDLTPELRTDLTATRLRWTTDNGSADALTARAERVLARGDLDAGRAAFQRAATGQGDPAAMTRAKVRLGEVELALGERLAERLVTAADKGLDQEAFSSLERLAQLVRETANPRLQDLWARLALPFRVQVDHPRTVLTITRSQPGGRPGAAETARAPEGTTGRWIHRATYAPGETLSISAARSGFASQTVVVTAQVRRSGAAVTLARGPAWRRDLGAVVTTPALLQGSTAIYGTNRASLVAIDAVTGADRPLAIEDAVSEVRHPPAIRDGRLFVGHEERIVAYDLASRARLWLWPEQPRPGLRFTGHVCVDRNELVHDQTLVFAAAAGQGVIVVGSSDRGRVAAFPRIALADDVTAAPFVDRSAERSVLGVPAGSTVHLYDITTLTEANAAQPIGDISARGDVVGQPAPARVGGRPAWLLADASGQVLAVDLGTGIADGRRVVAAWPVEGVPVGLQVVGTAVFTATSEGRINAFELGRPGQLRWRYPAQGALGTLSGAPTLGRKALYAADGTGQLHAIDPATGQLRWRADLGAPAVGAPVAVEGRVLVPVRTGQVVCFEEGEE